MPQQVTPAAVADENDVDAGLVDDARHLEIVGRHRDDFFLLLLHALNIHDGDFFHTLLLEDLNSRRFVIEARVETKPSPCPN